MLFFSIQECFNACVSGCGYKVSLLLMSNLDYMLVFLSKFLSSSWDSTSLIRCLKSVYKNFLVSLNVVTNVKHSQVCFQQNYRISELLDHLLYNVSSFMVYWSALSSCHSIAICHPTELFMWSNAFIMFLILLFTINFYLIWKIHCGINNVMQRRKRPESWNIVNWYSWTMMDPRTFDFKTWIRTPLSGTR